MKKNSTRAALHIPRHLILARLLRRQKQEKKNCIKKKLCVCVLTSRPLLTSAPPRARAFIEA